MTRRLSEVIWISATSFYQTYIRWQWSILTGLDTIRTGFARLDERCAGVLGWVADATCRRGMMGKRGQDSATLGQGCSSEITESTNETSRTPETLPSAQRVLTCSPTYPAMTPALWHPPPIPLIRSVGIEFQLEHRSRRRFEDSRESGGRIGGDGGGKQRGRQGRPRLWGLMIGHAD